MIQKELLKLQVEDLVPYENNPRVTSPEAVNACAESMRQCTALDPIEVDENNVILSGHTRRLALMQLHVDTADVVRYMELHQSEAAGVSAEDDVILVHLNGVQRGALAHAFRAGVHGFR